MPRDTYFNLDEEKRERVYQAIAKEFTRVPLEDVSVKNIVNDAAIPRGSFYQYFDDKEDVLRYLVVQTRREGEPGIRNGIEGKKSDIFDFILFLFHREMENQREDQLSLRMKILNQVTKSPRAMTIFNEEISKGATNHKVLKEFWKSSGLDSLSANEREALLELLISSLKEAFVSLLTGQSKAEKTREQLVFKLEVIKAGIGIKG